MEERFRFIEEQQKAELDFAELCRKYGVSRKTGYKWKTRYEEGGLENLQDQSRAPRNHPNEVSREIQERIVELRAEHPHWGPKKLWHWLQREEPQQQWPAMSTIGALLHRQGMSWARKPRRRATPSQQPLSHAQAPNHVWCTDYKGWFRCRNGQACYPLTLTDAASRFLLRCQSLERPDTERARPVFEAAFREYGMPEAMRSDNGAPFSSTAMQGLTRLNVWWIRLGIRLERIEPGHPQQNGRHERMHRTLKAETTQPPAATLRQQQELFDRFRQQYNQQRPHEALQYATPASLYRGSLRCYPAKLPELIYPGHFQQRRVGPNGELCWKYSWLFLTRALAGERVGIEEVGDGIWQIWFGEVPLGQFDERGDVASPSCRRKMWLKLRSPSGLPSPEPHPHPNPD